MNTVQFACGHCGQPFRVAASSGGQHVACPHCGQTNLVASATATPVVAQHVSTPASKAASTTPGEQASTLKIDTGAAESVARRHRRRKSSAGTWIALASLAVLLTLTGTLGWLYFNRQEPLRLAAIDNQVVDELETLSFTAGVRRPEEWSGRLAYRLIEAPPGAELDPQSGAFHFRPTEEQGPGIYPVTVGVTASGTDGASAEESFRIFVNEKNEPPELMHIDDVTVSPNDTVSLTVDADDPDRPRANLRFALTNAPRGAKIDAATGEFYWKPRTDAAGKTFPIAVRVKESVPGGLAAKAEFKVHVQRPAQPVVADAGRPAVQKMPADSPPPADVADTATGSEVKVNDDDKDLLELYRTNQLFMGKKYPAVRQIMANRFQTAHEEMIRAAYGDDYDAMTAWLDEHPDIKEEFYTAIDVENDDVPQALALFKQLKSEFPEKFESYANLAIATAVTWDQPRDGIVNYTHHATRAKATMPEEKDMVDAIGNFQYFVEAEPFMEGRCQLVPWEFLTLLVNHRTPIDERQWALTTYSSRRSMFGKCYSDVPYDTDMLNTSSEITRLDGRMYTLPNLLQYGGVCAHQADFASRVGKSIGVPAVSVGGTGRTGGGHAWVMWIELRQLTPKGIAFSLESHGRYRGDHYYVGTLRDPQTGVPITDRELELRLHVVGTDVLSTRQARLVMRAYPVLQELTDMDVYKRFDFLARVLDLCPGNEEAWIAVSKMSGDEVVKTKHKKRMMAILNGLFTTFAAYPDFTWTVFDDLVAVHDDPKERIKLYERLIALYVNAGRPDLAFAARDKLSDYLVEDERTTEALEGIALTIKHFPTEGRYVPGMLDKLEKLCGQVEGTDEHLVRFYTEFLPMIPQTRGKRPSEYCMATYRRGIKHFKKHGLHDIAAGYEAELAKLEALNPKKR